MRNLVRKNSILYFLLASLLLGSVNSLVQAQPETTIIIQENEPGMFSFDGIVATYNSGFTGSGYIDTDNGVGVGISWEICVPDTGEYRLEWRYAYGKTGNRTARILVDGSEAVPQVDFPSTGAYTSWDTTSAVYVTLGNGPHLIRLEATNSTGLANIDYIAVTGFNPSAGFCPVPASGVRISPTEATVGVKGFKQLSATVLPANATNQNVSWKSSDTLVASVDASGLVRGVKAGSAQIVVSTEDGFFTDTCFISSIIVPIYYLEISVNGEGEVFPTSDSIAEGSQVCLTAIPAGGWKFDGWSGDTSGTENPLCITMDTSRSIAANFSENPYGHIIGFGDQKPDGFAGYMGTNGGGTTTPVIVSTPSEFISAVSTDAPAVIIVDGLLNVGDVTIASNKTLVGMDENAGLHGGTIKIRGSNYIIQNLNIGPSGADAMELSGASKVFITKCAMHDAGDEILSIVRESDYVTVSWCKFYFDNTHSHAFGHLIGNSDDRTSDRGKLHVTMHHNWYAPGIRGRQPRVRYGHVHIYNNYYNSVGSGYCIGVGYECHIRVENTFFEGVSAPWADYGGVDNGEIGWNGLKFKSSSQPTFVKNSFPMYNLPYAYVADPVDSVKAIVLAGAGNVFGTDNTVDTIRVAVTAPSDQEEFETNSTIVLEAEASVTDGALDRVQFYQNHQLIAEALNPPYSVSWDSVPGGSYKITARAVNLQGKSTFSDIIQISVSGGVGMPDPRSKSFVLFPNPATDLLTIRLEDDDWINAHVSLYDSTGELILKEQVYGNEHRMDLSSLTPGIYLITLAAEQNYRVKKLVKE